jgi:exodeoxyribonuclease V alpha subunit
MATEEDEEEEEQADQSDAKFDLGYAITTHKSQGSEAKCVIVVIDPMGRSVCSREHVYTSISRAKELCVMIGKRAVCDSFCRNVALGKRKTFLVELLAKG